MCCGGHTSANTLDPYWWLQQQCTYDQSWRNTEAFDITHDARQAANNWGVEYHHDMGKIGMFSLCHNLAYACAAQRPFVQDPAVCDYNKYVQSHDCGDIKWATESYKQIDARTCRNDMNKSPRYDHCGLYLYGSSVCIASAR